MGEMIHLTIGRLELDWGKNEFFIDHSALFQSKDLTQIPYYYAGDADDPKCALLPLIQKGPDFQYRLITEYKEGFSSPLSVVAQRLQVMGYTDASCRREFESLIDYEYANHDFTFDEIKALLSKSNFSAAAFAPTLGSDDLPDFIIEHVLPNLAPAMIGRLQRSSETDGQVDGLTAYSILHLLAANPTAADLPVTWQFSDVAEGGYVPRESFRPVVDVKSRFLIVTEGSSDVQVIRHALELLRPDIADFFDFVDMQDNYPFSGTGNLYNFVRGLISIGIQNQILVIFDNDSEGVFNWQRSTKLKQLPTMRIVKLPDRDCFKSFRTLGPTGEHSADINGKAAAIECYLSIGPERAVRWTSYDQRRDCYQGHIEGKEHLAKEFLDQRSVQPGYDYTGLSGILDMLTDACASIAESRL